MVFYGIGEQFGCQAKWKTSEEFRTNPKGNNFRECESSRCDRKVVGRPLISASMRMYSPSVFTNEVLNCKSPKFLMTMGRTKPSPNKGSLASDCSGFVWFWGAELIFLELFEAAYLVDLGELALFHNDRELAKAEVLELLLKHDPKYVHRSLVFIGWCSRYSPSHFRVYCLLKRYGIIVTRTPNYLELPFYDYAGNRFDCIRFPLTLSFQLVLRSHTIQEEISATPWSVHDRLGRNFRPDQIKYVPLYALFCTHAISFVGKANDVEVVLALGDCSMKHNFISLKIPKDITNATHRKKGKNVAITQWYYCCRYCDKSLCAESLLILSLLCSFFIFLWNIQTSEN